MDHKQPWYDYESREWIQIKIAEKLDQSKIEPLKIQDFDVKSLYFEYENGSGNYQKLTSNISHLKLILADDKGHPDWQFAIVENLAESLSSYELGTTLPEISIQSEFDTSSNSLNPFNLFNVQFFKDEKDERLKLSFKYTDETNIYGLGEKYFQLDKKGRRYTFYNTDNDASLTRKEPMYQSHMYMLMRIPIKNTGKISYIAVFSHRPEMTYIDLGGTQPNTAEIEVFSTIMDLYFIKGDTPYDVIEQYSALTGKMPLPPLWSLGTHQCRWGYRSSSDIREITQNYRKHHIPCDAIWYDIDYMDVWADFTWHPERFKDYKDLNKEMHDANWHIVTIIDPGMALKSNYPQITEGILNNYFSFKDQIKAGTLGIYESPVWPLSALFPDFYRTEVKAYWAKLNKNFMVDSGVDGIWNDMNELVCFKSPDRKTWPHMLHLDDQGNHLRHFDVHNMYALEEAKATYDGILQAYPDRRPFVLTRAGFPSIQRWAATWTGDNYSVFDEILNSIPMIANLGISGQPFVGADIGGFAGACYPPLLIRWSELGAFYPFARNHSAHSAQEPWAFNMFFPITEFIIKTYYRFRYMLLPYLYSKFHFASQTGFPIWRALVIQYSDDSKTVEINDEVLIGESILLAPSYSEPDEEDDLEIKEIDKLEYSKLDSYSFEFLPDNRMIYLPKDEHTLFWFDIWKNEWLEAGTEFDDSIPIFQIPLYIRNNSIIPCRLPEETTSCKSPDIMIFNIFSKLGSNIPLSSKKCDQSYLYVDAGEGFDYRDNNEFNLYTMQANSDENSIIVKIEATQETDSARVLKQNLFIVHGISQSPKDISCNGKLINQKEWSCRVPRFHPFAWNETHDISDLSLPLVDTAQWNEDEKIFIVKTSESAKNYEIVLKF
jgi:alpha-glucosidase